MNRLSAYTAIALLALATTSHAVTTTDISAANPFLFGDLVTFNWRILNQVNPLIPIPATPTGNQTTFIRMYTNGNTHNPDPATTAIPFAPGNVSEYPEDINQFDSNERSLYWYGLEFQQDAVSTVLTATDVLNFIQSVSGPDAVNPLFAFDQNQEGSDPDIFLWARLILVDPSVTLSGLTAAQVDAAVAAAILSGDATVFSFLDDPALPNGPEALPGGSGYVLLPGVFDPDFDPDPLSPFQPVDNNGAGNNADWGGYIAGLDLNDFLGYSFLVDLRASFNNNGKEEAYILGGLAGPDDDDDDDDDDPGVPEPLTAGLSLISAAGLGLAAMRRRNT